MDKMDLKIQSCLQHKCENIKLELVSEKTVLTLLEKYLHQDAQVVAWFNHRVTFGKWENQQLVWAEDLPFDDKQFLELRAFNENEELYLQENGNVRYISDNDGKDIIEYVDSYSHLWGERTEKTENGFVKLRDEGRKLQMVVPYAGDAKNYELYLRSYIGYDGKTGQAGYTAYRYLKIVAVVR